MFGSIVCFLYVIYQVHFVAMGSYFLIIRFIGVEWVLIMQLLNMKVKNFNN
jgi:hypothetical protein